MLFRRRLTNIFRITQERVSVNSQPSVKPRMRWLSLMLNVFMSVQGLLFPLASIQAQSHQAATTTVEFDPALAEALPEAGTCVLYEDGGQIRARQATREEALAMQQRDSRVRLAPLNPTDYDKAQQQQTGLRIILRGTPQLDQFPQARAAFLRAAARWEAVIQTPITMVIDVDYGPTRFGQPFPNNIIGSTNSQQVGSPTLYPLVRSRLIETASSAEEAALYNALPNNTVITDLGATAAILCPTAPLRAIGLLPAAADPDGERQQLGNPPAIGFNSAYTYDFDPSDGIDPDKRDFDAAAVHEIGHALGFTSNVGIQELEPTAPLVLSIWDLFRFRPGTTPGTFTGAPRLCSSGGEHVFFAGGRDVPLSTGRPDGTGGDNRQSSHWKDNVYINQYIGIMDPTLAAGDREEITDNDLLALDAFGYRVNRSGPPNSNVVPLTSGVPVTGSIAAPNPGSGVLGQPQYAITVPAGARELRITLNGNQDVDLYLRVDQPIVIQNGRIVADAASESPTGMEFITVTSPPARTYYLAVANFGPGAASFTLTATVTR